ncbi:MAG: hypothetical protein LBV20_04555 [Treponema sp.]|jgi:hypothetical protein|nr:hypothetical protein [Treponema sp.]
MKKFIVSLIILIILGGVVFYFGWVKAAVPAGEYGVIVSKTHGVDTELIQDGQFRWLWYKLIPTNIKTLVFKLTPKEGTISISGNLPSASTYASFSGVSMDFSYEVSGSYSFLLNAERLPSLVENHIISDNDSLQNYMNSLSEKISGFIVQQLQSYSSDPALLESLQGNPIPSDLTSKVQSMFPEIIDFSCMINTVRFPDFDLYHSAKSLYQNYLSRQGEILMEQAAAETAERNIAEQRYDDLKRYGELLTEYPVLIQYMAIEKGLDEVMKSLPMFGEN